MTEAIIDTLEVIQVQVQHGAAVEISNRFDALFLEATPIQDAGKRIAQRICQHFVFAALTLCNVCQSHREIIVDGLAGYTQPHPTCACFGSDLVGLGRTVDGFIVEMVDQ